MERKEICDIENKHERRKHLSKQLRVLRNRMVAIALDYQYYLDHSWNQKSIFSFRDEINLRLYSCEFQLDLIIRQLNEINLRAKMIDEENRNNKNSLPLQGYYHVFEQQIISLFDGLFYHLVSVFDYFAKFISYSISVKEKPLLRWMQLLRSMRDPKNELSSSNLSRIIIDIDRGFVGKLYDHRSHVIHKAPDNQKSSHTITFSNKGIKHESHFFIGDQLSKRFSELKNISKTKRISVVFASYWAMERSIEHLNQVLFGLRDEFKAKSEGVGGMFVYIDPKTNEMKSPSTGYWHENITHHNKT